MLMKSVKKTDHDHSTWLAQYKGGSLNQYRRTWQYFVKFLEEKDEQWIMQNKYTEDWGAHIVNFHRWLKRQPMQRGRGKMSDNTVKTLANSLRAYFVHIGAPLSLNKIQKEELVKVESTPRVDYPFNLNVKARLLVVADPLEEYVVCAGVSFGLRIGDFLKITRGMLEPLLDQEVPIKLPPIQTKKKGVKAYPFIDKDCLQAVKRLVKELDRKGKTRSDDRICSLTAFETNYLLKKLFERAGIETGEYSVRFHILRKFLTDMLASVCASDKWKHFVGKSASSPYVSSEGREAYKKVMEFTNVNGERVRSNDVALTLMKNQIKDQKLEIEKLNKKFEKQTQLNKQITKVGEDLKKWQEEKTELEAKIAGVENFQKLVSEQSDEVVLGFIKDVRRQLKDKRN
jgi:hypothetical protein